MYADQLIRVAVAMLTLSQPIVASIPSEDGWKLVWGDDFSGKSGSLPKSSNWKLDKGTSYPGGPANWGTGEIQTYTSSTKNVYVSKSSLHIKPLRDSSGAWTSGRIESRRGNFMAQKGMKMKITARISMPDVGSVYGAGYWPAFWTMGSKFRGNYTNWPSIGEYDIMENVNGMKSVVSALHCGVNPGGSCNEPEGLGAQLPCRGSDCSGNYHTYSVIVDRTTSPEAVKFFTDGVLHKAVSSADVDSESWDKAVHHGHFIIMNVAIGGAYPNAANSAAGGTGVTPNSKTASGKAMTVKYVAVYEQ